MNKKIELIDCELGEDIKEYLEFMEYIQLKFIEYANTLMIKTEILNCNENKRKSTFRNDDFRRKPL